eukprot:m.71658 g.71658  ORF g.71658 m.71658 type:complete len:399 (+) comp16088_c0_seq1:100-1296(+)
MSDPTVHAEALKSDIRSAVINKKVNACPMAVRLAWHASGTFDKDSGTGGSDGSTMRFEPESTDDANAGLGIMRSLLQPVYDKNPDVSKADIWIAAGAFAVEATGGPSCPVAFCRSDAADNSQCPENGRLPDATQGAQHLRDVFYRMGFDDREIVALSGAHTLGRCHLSRSGFDGPWTTNPLKFDNEYFRNLLEKTWIPKKYSGKPMMEDQETGLLAMLPTDMALIEDDKFRVHVERYAKDEQAFFDEFAAAFSKLCALGTKCPDAKKAVDESKSVDKSAQFLDWCMHGSEREARNAAATCDVLAVESNSGRTALHKASFWGHAHLIGFLTAEHCNIPVNAVDHNGDTALHDAARFGHKEVCEKLIAEGADKSIRNKAGSTAKDLAMGTGHTDLAELVL